MTLFTMLFRTMYCTYIVLFRGGFACELVNCGGAMVFVYSIRNI